MNSVLVQPELSESPPGRLDWLIPCQLEGDGKRSERGGDVPLSTKITRVKLACVRWIIVLVSNATK